jgi:hypothetical protein
MNPQTHAVHAGHGAHAHAEPETVHRWVVFGTDTVYLSHLSMFSMPEHAMQVIVEAEFAERDGSPSSAYIDDRRNHPKQKLYTLDPAVFALPDILPADGRSPRRTTLEADLYRNHVEQAKTKPEVIGSGLEVRIKHVVHARRYDPDARPPSNLEYILFGTGKEPYLAHFITRPPDFDQIIRVTIDHDLPDEQLANGCQLTVPNRANKLDDRLNEGTDPVSAILHTADGDIRVKVTPEVEYYCNFDRDLQ